MKIEKLILISLFSGLLGEPVVMKATVSTTPVVGIAVENKSNNQIGFFDQIKKNTAEGVGLAIKYSIPTIAVCTIVYFIMVKPLNESLDNLGQAVMTYQDNMSTLANSFAGINISANGLNESFNKYIKPLNQIGSLSDAISSSNLYMGAFRAFFNKS